MVIILMLLLMIRTSGFEPSFSVEAIRRLRDWPLARRRESAAMAGGAVDHFDEDLSIAACERVSEA